MSLVPSKASKKRRLNVFPEARTNEIPFKPNVGTNQRLTIGSSAVYPRFMSGTAGDFSWCLHRIVRGKMFTEKKQHRYIGQMRIP